MRIAQVKRCAYAYADRSEIVCAFTEIEPISNAGQCFSCGSGKERIAAASNLLFHLRLLYISLYLCDISMGLPNNILEWEWGFLAGRKYEHREERTFRI